MIKKNLLSFNFNSWMPVSKGMSYKKRIKRFAGYIRSKYGNAAVIAIQEFISGGGKYLNDLYEAFGKDYYIIVPPSFDYRAHPRSLITVTLLKKSIIERYEVKDLGKCLPNRISYIVAWVEGQPWTIMNIYMVQTANFAGKPDWYVSLRKKLHSELWEEVISEAVSQRGERVILLGDFQESSEGVNMQTLNEMGYKEVATGFPTVKNDFFKEWNIDHILFSQKAWSEFNPSGFTLDGDLIGELSDHCLLAVMSA
ncbi:MAG: hypothetical protein K6E47_13110 [Lachnospiraceae bacterium]|nr:hypothetical protein [Lachnospiraceae bacterium]